MANKQPKYVTMIDPPHGCIYGFPKAMPDGVENVSEWLVENGYPKHIIDKLGKDFIYRIILKEIKTYDGKKTNRNLQ